MIKHQQVLALARQGEAQAIAYLINQVLNPRGIHVRALRKTGCLHVLLEAAQTPDPATYARVVYAAVLCLGAPTVQTLQVYGRQKGDQLPVWVQAFRMGGTGRSGESDGVGGVEAEKRQSQIGVAESSEAASEAAFVEFSPFLPQSDQADPATVLPRLSSKLVLPLALTVGTCFGAGAGLSYLQSRQLKLDATALQSTVAPVVPSPTVSPSPTPSTSPTSSNSSPSPFPLLPHPPTSAKVAVTLKAVGDMIPGSNYPGRALPTEVGEQLDAEREFLFGNIKPFFGDNDILFGNFESTLTDYPYSAKDTSRGMTFAFRTPPVYAQMLKDLGFDVLSVANNHSFDFGDQGFADTISHIEQAGMKAVGKKDQIVYTTVNGVPMAFIGFSYLSAHNQMHDLAAAGALVQEAKKQAKIVVVSVHAGAEGSDEIHVADRNEYFFGEDRGNMVAFSRSMIEQGADLILGHGPHVPRALELYNNKLIAYSLGNFIGYKTLSTTGTLGYSLILTVQMDSEGNFVGGRVIPVALDRNGIPKLDDYFQSVVLIRNLIKSDFPQTPITLDDMGYIVRLDK